MVNSLYLQAAQLAINTIEEGRKPKEYQMNRWTLDQVIDEVALLSPTQWESDDYSTALEFPVVGKLLDIPVRLNENLKDIDIVLIEEKENPLDKPRAFVVRL